MARFKINIKWARSGECMIVTSHKPTQDGYIKMCRGGRMFRLHRLVCERTHGKIPDGLEVLHSCDTPSCINPDHLSAGTHLQNISDAAKRKRMKFGESSHKAVLSEVKVLKIMASNLSFTELARSFGVHRSTIHSIKKGKSWKHLRYGI